MAKRFLFRPTQGFQNPRSIDEVVFKRLINWVSTRKYENAALEVPAAFGIKKSSISHYETAKKKLNLMKRELAILNESAVRSLEEGMEETLTLHRLNMFPKLGISFKTSNCIENIMRQVGIYTDRVSYWKSSDQRQRWVGTALQEIEPKLRLVRG